MACASGSTPNAEAIVDTGGVPVVIGQMRQYSDSPGVAMWATGCLAVIADLAQHKVGAIIVEGGVAAIIAGLKAHPGNPKHVETGFHALGQISMMARGTDTIATMVAGDTAPDVWATCVQT